MKLAAHTNKVKHVIAEKQIVYLQRSGDVDVPLMQLGVERYEASTQCQETSRCIHFSFWYCFTHEFDLCAFKVVAENQVRSAIEQEI